MAVSYTERDHLIRGDVLHSFRWSAIFGGLLAALATQIVLSAIGAAIGVTATAVAENEGAARGLGIGAGVWMILTPLISMFAGGLVAAWLSRPLDRKVAAMHGGMVWALSLVVGAFFLGTVASGMVNRVIGASANTAGQVVAEGTNTTREQRDDLRAEARDKKNEAKAKVDQNKEKIADTADKAANVGTGVAWASVLAMLLSLGAAVLGALSAHRSIFGPDRTDTGRFLGSSDRIERSEIVRDRAPVVGPPRNVETESTIVRPPDLH